MKNFVVRLHLTFTLLGDKMLFLFVLFVIVLPLLVVWGVFIFSDFLLFSAPLSLSVITMCLSLVSQVSFLLFYLHSEHHKRLLESYRKKIYEQKQKEIDVSIKMSNTARDTGPYL